MASFRTTFCRSHVDFLFAMLMYRDLELIVEIHELVPQKREKTKEHPHVGHCLRLGPCVLYRLLPIL